MSRKKAMGRSANGTGSIRKVTTMRNGKEYTYWQARYTEGYDPGTGKQIQRSVTGKTQKEVAQKLKQLTHELDLGTYQAPNKQTVGEWLDLWAETYLGGVKPRTVEVYNTIIRVHLKPALGAIKMESLTTSTVQRCYNNLLKAGISAKYLRTIHGVLHKALQQAVLINQLRSNPATPCALPRVTKKDLTPFDDNQISAFLKEIRGAQLECLLVVTLFTGLRQGEVMGLMWDCVDFESGTILINKQLQYFREKPNYVFRIVPTKNGKGRVIKPAPSVMALLKEHKAAQDQQRLTAGSSWEESNLVFTDELGHHLNNSILYRHFKRAAIAIGRPDARFHDLRHSYAVAAIRSGDDIKTVQDNLGHATASFTLDVYGHVTEQMKKASSDRMEQFFNSVAPQESNKAKNKAKL